ncbi:MAG: hypothetical protein QOI35_291 [Cryptosporangiaceae bacterium]|nr:hypothetical protein [Cryptosporangiaceae bacterium]
MISAAWLTGTALLIGSLCVVLATVTALWRAVQDGRRRRRARLLAPVRPLVLRLAAGGDEDGDAVRTLTGLDRRTWASVEPLVVKMLGKIRGEARGELVGLLQRHGAGARARVNLSSRSMTARATAAETLGVLGEMSAAEPVRALLTDPSPDVRQVAARALGYTGDPSVADDLLDALGSVPAQTIAQTLLNIGSTTAPTLISALNDERDSVRSVAVEVLGLFQFVGAVKPLGLMLPVEPSLQVQLRIATALGRLGHPGALGPLTAALAPRHPAALRASAAAALGQLGASRAVTPLAGLLADPAHAVASAAAAALTRLGPAGVSALADMVAADPPPGGARILIHEGGRHRAVPPGQAGAHAAAALDTMPKERGKVRA